MPKISVIIPCYNYGKYVEEAIDSVLASTFHDFEILVVNDGSTDEYTNKLLKGLNKPKTRVIWQHNQGLAQSRNNGIKEALCKYILPLDADDTIEPTLLEKAYWILEMNPDLGLVYFHARLFGDENYIWETREYNLYNLLFENSISVCSLLRKKAWEEVGGYNPNMTYGYEDWEFWINLGKHGWHGQLLSEPLFNHRKHGRSMTNEAHEKHQLLIEQIKNNHPDLFERNNLKRIKKEWSSRSSYGWFPIFKYILKKISPPWMISIERKIFRLWVLPYYSRFLSAYRPLKNKLYYNPFYFKCKKEGVWDIKKWIKNPIGCLMKIWPSTEGEFISGKSRSKDNKHDAVNIDDLKRIDINYETNADPSKKNILFVLPWLKCGGAEIVLYEKIKNLPKDEFNFFIVTTEDSDNEWNDKFKEITPYIYHLPKMGFKSGEDCFNFMVLFLTIHNINILHVIHSECAYRNLSKIKTIFPELKIFDTLHNSVPEGFIEFAKKYDEYIDKHIVIAEHIKEKAVHKYKIDPDKIKVILNGIDTGDRFNPENYDRKAIREKLDIPRDAKVITYIGRLSEEKCPIGFVKIASRVIPASSCHPELDSGSILFLVVGDGPQMPEIKKAIKKYGLESHMRLLGFRDDTPEILAATDVLVNTSHIEGLSITIMEALSMNVPVVATDVGGTGSLIENGVNGYLVKKRSSRIFAKKILKIPPDIKPRAKVIERFNVRRMGEEYGEVYNKNSR